MDNNGKNGILKKEKILLLYSQQLERISALLDTTRAEWVTMLYKIWVSWPFNE